MRVRIDFSFIAVFFIALLITALRLYYLQLGTLGLFADESQYWLWAQRPGWGYYSKPPFVAWAIALSTYFCGGESAYCVKWASPAAYGVTALLVYLLGRDLFN